MPINRTLARMSDSWPTRWAASRLASVSRRFVCTQRIGSLSHQPSRAERRPFKRSRESGSLFSTRKPLPNGRGSARFVKVRGALPLVVIFLSQVGNEIFALHPAQGVLQFHQLNENIML